MVDKSQSNTNIYLEKLYSLTCSIYHKIYVLYIMSGLQRQYAQSYDTYPGPNPERVFPSQSQQPPQRQNAQSYSTYIGPNPERFFPQSLANAPPLNTPRGGKQYRSKSKRRSTNRKRKGGSKRKKNTRRRK